MELQRGENPAAVGHAEDILRVAPMNITAHLVRSFGLANMGEYDRARQELDALLKYDPKLNDAHFQLGRMDVMQKRYPEAEAEFAVLQKANDPRGFTGLLDSKVTQGRADEAMRMVQDALAKSPNNAGLENMLATLQYNTGHYTDAVAEYKQMLQQSPNAAAGDREVWYLRMGEALRRSGDLNGAITAFNDASRAAPKDTAPRLEIAMLFDATGRKDEARKAYEEILKDQPDNPIALNNLAYFDADNDRDLDKALSYAQLAQKKSPHDVNISDTLGLIYFKKGLVEESSRLFADLVNRAPNNATYHLHLAMALYKKGDKLQARRELEAASKNRPTARDQEQIKDLMSKIG
jgi:tetratricopeptide (TPR) repeat protein